ncbi:hypothetical protein KJ840_01830 [Patescibacteria group bacterium]|nr:hypothetical protein [Patescibacteria group bacterium]
MKVEYISSKEQMLIAENLYNITDSIEAAKRLEEECGIKITYGKSVELRDFARKLDKTKFFNWEIEKAIEKHSGHKIRLRDL